MASPGFNLTFTAFRRMFVNSSGVSRAFESAARVALTKIGTIQRRHARRKIKRRAVTRGQWDRLRAAQQSGDRRRVKRLLATIDRKRQDSSPPNHPPYSHAPDHPVASIRAIYFAVRSNSVVVGPVKANQVTVVGSNRSTVPELLEFGGVATVAEESLDKGQTWRRSDLRRNRKPWKKYRRRTARYAKRPFMGPTFTETYAKTREIVRAAYVAAARKVPKPGGASVRSLYSSSI